MLQRIHDLIVQSANTASSDSTARHCRPERDRAAPRRDRPHRQHDVVRQPEPARRQLRRPGRSTSSGTRRRHGAGVDDRRRGAVSFDLMLDSATPARLQLVTVTSPRAPTPRRRRSRPSCRPTSTRTDRRGDAGFTGAVTVNVRDLGCGAWTVEFVRNSTDAGTERRDQRRRRRHRAGDHGERSAATVANTGGGVFQVGANVTANEPDRTCRSTTSGSPAARTVPSRRCRAST